MKCLRSPAALAVVVATLAPAPAARAWGNVGHALVCQIAYLELSASARAKVDAILAARVPEPGLRWKSLAFACTFPDNPHVHGDARHYMNVARTAAKIDSESCGASDTCLFTAIRDDRAKLGDASLSNAERKVALANLGHWVGDLHQPLHVSFEDDQGGNKIRVTGRCASADYESANLHGVWDRCLVESPHGLTSSSLTHGFPKIGPIRAIAGQLRKGITAAQRSDWRSSDPVEWAEESFRIAERAKTRYCTKKRGACWYAPGSEKYARKKRRPVAADDAYVEANEKTVDGRLRRAGVRLAKLIENALGR